MSEILLELSEPLERELGRPDDPESFRALLRFTATAWNRSRSGANREGGVSPPGAGVLLEELPAPAGRGRTIGEETLRELAERAGRDYPDDPRTVVDVRVTRPDEDFRVYALTDTGTGSGTGLPSGPGEAAFGPETAPPDPAAAGPGELLEGTNLSPGTEAIAEEAVEELERVARDEDLNAGLRDRAGDLLALHAMTEPEQIQRSRKPEVWSAGALHAAPLTTFLGAASEGAPTIEEAARLFGVSDASTAEKSRALRDSWETVLEAGAHPRYPGASPGMVRLATAAAEPVRGGDGVWEVGAEDTARQLLSGSLDLPTGEGRERGFDARRLAERHGLTEGDARSLSRAARRAAKDHYREEMGKDPAGRSMSDVLEWPDAFGRFLREALRGGVGSEDARDALSLRAVVPLVRPLGEPPHSVLLPLARLARRGCLGGRPLAAAASLAFRDPDSLAGLRTEELRSLWRALGRTDELSAEERAVGLASLVRAGAAAPGPHRATDLVAAVARDDQVPVEVRRGYLERSAERSRNPLLPGRTSAGVRRYALRHRAELEPEPWRAAVRLTEEAREEGDEQRWRAAAEVLREHGDAAPGGRVRELVREGLEAPKAAARQAWYRTGLELIGGDVREWAPDDVLRREESSGRSGGSGSGGDPAQTSLF